MRRFGWLPAGPIPHGCDLRRLGWVLRDHGSAATGDDPCPVLAAPLRMGMAPWIDLAVLPAAQRRWIFMLGVDSSEERARLLRIGYGDASDWSLSLGELAQRVERLGERAVSVPRWRRVEGLALDLVRRDGVIAGRALGLHPREFALLWRLAESPGAAVDSGTLLCDVWRMHFRPETNSLAVHVSRLRAKLRLAGLHGLIETLPDGSYRLAVGGMSPAAGHLALDAPARLREEQAG